jgi:hypothetical protein
MDDVVKVAQDYDVAKRERTNEDVITKDDDSIQHT